MRKHDFMVMPVPQELADDGPMPDHFSAGVLWRVNEETKQLEFLIVEYWKVKPDPVTGKTRALDSFWKFPGGTNRDSMVPLRLRYELPSKTLLKEWKQEVGLVPAGAWPKCYVIPVERDSKPYIDANQKEWQKEPHCQFYFIMDNEDIEPGGRLRKYVRRECEAGVETEFIGPPRWISARELTEPGSPFRMVGRPRVVLDHVIQVLVQKGRVPPDFISARETPEARQERLDAIVIDDTEGHVPDCPDNLDDDPEDRTAKLFS